MTDTTARVRPIRVCVALASKMAGEFLSREFSSRMDLPITCVNVSADEVLPELARSAFRILITNLDLHRGRHSGLELLTEAISLHRGLRGIVLGSSPACVDVLAAFRAGARGYLLESDASVETLVKAILCVHEGQVWASSAHLNLILDEFSVQMRRSRAVGQLQGILTERERQVIDLIMVGKSNKEIAAALQVSGHTVKNHLVNIFAKLRVTSRTEAIFAINERYSSCDDGTGAPPPVMQGKSGASVIC